MSSSQTKASNTASGLPRWPSLSAYASLRMPLALLELPLFVLLPNFYSSTLGVELAIVGTVLFLARLLDAIFDPALGGIIDRNSWRWQYRQWIWLALPVLALGFAAMMNPPVNANLLPAWLAVTSMVTYLGYSITSIAYQAWGAEIGHTDAHRARVTGVRESFGLVGVLIASVFLTPEGIPALTTLFIVMALGSGLAMIYAPPAVRRQQSEPGHQESPLTARPGMAQILFGSWSVLKTNLSFRWLLIVMLLNGIATAIPATLVLFFIEDVLRSPDQAPLFLGAYFLAGAAGMPLWIWLAAKIGLRNSWLLGMGFSVIAFIWALELGAGDTKSFMAVCVMTGLALGADLALPPALLASVIANHKDSGRREGAYFGVWNFTTKFNLAAAAGLALPLLSYLGYEPGVTQVAGSALALPMVYAALPSVLKLLAAMLLFVSPLNQTTTSTTTIRTGLQ